MLIQFFKYGTRLHGHIKLFLRLGMQLNA